MFSLFTYFSSTWRVRSGSARWSARCTVRDCSSRCLSLRTFRTSNYYILIYTTSHLVVDTFILKTVLNLYYVQYNTPLCSPYIFLKVSAETTRIVMVHFYIAIELEVFLINLNFLHIFCSLKNIIF